MTASRNLRAEGLVKSYGKRRVVDALSLRVDPGEIVGLLGPNGAGKTTTMRMLTGFVPPTAGRAEICGFPVEEQPSQAKRCLGYLPEGAPSYGEMTPAQFLGFISRVRGLQGERAKSRMDDVVGRLHLGPVGQLHGPGRLHPRRDSAADGVHGAPAGINPVAHGVGLDSKEGEEGR